MGTLQKDAISISKDKGVLTVEPGIAEKKLGYDKNYIRATSTDGSGKYAIRYFSVYPAPGKIRFWYRPEKAEGETASAYQEVSSFTMQKGKIAELKITNENQNSYQGYYVTYTTGAGKAAYYIPTDAPEKISCSDTATYIKVSALKKGTITLTASTQDGSNKKEVLKITVTD